MDQRNLVPPRPRITESKRFQIRHFWGIRWVAWLLALMVWAGTSTAAPASYTIDSAASRIVVQVQREGLFAVLGHDHVLAVRELRGHVVLDKDQPAAASLDLRIPVASIEVDPPELRETLGISGTLNVQDRSEIRENMLASDQLAAEDYPDIMATLEGLAGTWPEMVLTVRIRIRDTVRTVTIPAKLSLKGGRLEASGEFSLVQSDFGIAPYRALLGAIGVEDQVLVTFHIIANAEP